jgi:predicted enzyme related to lactoylglutathione lyase
MTPAGRLVGVITASSGPDRLAEFYQSALGIPYQLNQHGTMPPHYECDLGGIHYAIIQAPGTESAGNVTISFQVDDLEAFLAALEARGVRRLHNIMALGGGPRICTIADPDGNRIRLYESRQPS